MPVHRGSSARITRGSGEGRPTLCCLFSLCDNDSVSSKVPSSFLPSSSSILESSRFTQCCFFNSTMCCAAKNSCCASYAGPDSWPWWPPPSSPPPPTPPPPSVAMEGATPIPATMPAMAGGISCCLRGRATRWQKSYAARTMPGSSALRVLTSVRSTPLSPSLAR